MTGLKAVYSIKNNGELVDKLKIMTKNLLSIDYQKGDNGKYIKNNIPLRGYVVDICSSEETWD